MADKHDLFKRLCLGAKFEKKTLAIGLQKIQPSLAKNASGSEQQLSETLDFFGNKAKIDDIISTSECTSDDSPTKRGKGATSDSNDSNENPSFKIRKSKKKKLSKKTVELHLEKINALRNTHRIFVKGSDIPDPVENFEVLRERYSFPDYIIRNVKERGYAEPTAIQMQAMPLMLQGREILCCAPTGSGKTAAFILPILYDLKKPRKSGFRALVVSPTRELAQQIYRELCHMSKGCAFRIHILNKANATSNSFGQMSSKRFDILVTTPNRLIHLLSQDPPGINLASVKWLVLDEADKLFEEGKDGFRDQIATIYQECSNEKIKHALFSATLSNGVEEWSKVHLDNYVQVTVGARNAATQIVEQELLFVGQESGKLLAMQDIIHKGISPPVLVFVQSKDRAKELFHELIYDGINVDVIHSDRTQAQIWFLIATELMGRGIDFKGVNLVINYDFPTSAVSYIHRIGRTGRAGRPGKAITFFTEADVVNLRSIANVMKASGCEIPDWMLKIKKPNRNTKKQLQKAPIKRQSIKTVTKYDLSKAKRKRDVIEGTKQTKNKKIKSS